MQSRDELSRERARTIERLEELASKLERIGAWDELLHCEELLAQARGVIEPARPVSAALAGPPGDEQIPMDEAALYLARGPQSVVRAVRSGLVELTPELKGELVASVRAVASLMKHESSGED